MKNKQHEYILKAFVNSKIPAVIRRRAPELIAVDSAVGGYCERLISHEKFIELPSAEIISADEKAAFAELTNHSSGAEKDELTVYYRLLILAESVLIQYRQ